MLLYLLCRRYVSNDLCSVSVFVSVFVCMLLLFALLSLCMLVCVFGSFFRYSLCAILWALPAIRTD